MSDSAPQVTPPAEVRRILRERRERRAAASARRGGAPIGSANAAGRRNAATPARPRTPIERAKVQLADYQGGYGAFHNWGTSSKGSPSLYGRTVSVDPKAPNSRRPFRVELRSGVEFYDTPQGAETAAQRDFLAEEDAKHRAKLALLPPVAIKLTPSQGRALRRAF